MKNWRANSPLSIAVRLSVLYVLLCAVAFALQRSLLYFPSHDEPTGYLSPWRHEGKTIGYCWEVSNPCTVWLLMHGNAGQASDRDYVLDRLPATDSLYVLEYPGYGGRDGKPSRDAFDRAARAAYDRLTEMYPATPIGVIGESIGSGPAASLATAARPPDKIVLVVPFDSLPRVAARRLFFLPVGLLMRDRWDNVAALRSYSGPIDIFCAAEDTIIPCHHARNLAEQLSTATYHEVPGGHNDWSRQAKVKIQR